MADFSKIQFKRTHSVGKKPTKDDLKAGEIAFNGADNSFFVKHSDNHIVKLGAGNVGNDSDIRYHVDSDGKIYASSLPEGHFIINTDDDTNDWQQTAEMRTAGAGTKATVFRTLTENNTVWTKGSNVATVNSGWDGVVAGGGIAILTYGTVTSYAMPRSYYNDTYRLERAYVENGDHATLGILNNYFIYQTFMVPVNIGNGTILGQFENGRSSLEHFREAKVEFYDAEGNIIVEQTWTGQGFGTKNIDVSGNITGVRSIIMRGHNGTNYNPGFNDINFYVNGSTDFPGTTWTNDGKWGGAWRSYAGGTSRSDTEVFVLLHLSSTAGMLVGGVWNFVRGNDWAPNGNTDSTNQVYFAWFHRPWAISGGAYFNGRVPYQAQYWQTVRWTYFDHDDIQVEDYTQTFNAQGQSGTLKPHKDVWKILVRPSGRSQNHPVIQYFRPILSDWNEETGVTVHDNPELWIKMSSSTSTPGALTDGLPPVDVWKKIT